MFTNKEIAETLNISEKTVEGHLTKGTKLLRLYLKESGLLTLVSMTAHEWFK